VLPALSPRMISGWWFLTRSRRARGWGCGGRGRAPFPARLGRSRDLGEGQRVLAVADRDCALLILPHPHPALGRRPVLTLPLQLQQLVFIAHHPVFTHHAFFFQPEHLVELPRARSSPVIVGGCRRGPGIAPVVFGQIVFLQIGIGLGAGPAVLYHDSGCPTRGSFTGGLLRTPPHFHSSQRNRQVGVTSLQYREKLHCWLQRCAVPCWGIRKTF
jgi:hypothetical protein